MGLLSTGTLGWDPSLLRGTLAVELILLIFIRLMWLCDQLVLCLHPFYLFWCGFFFISLITELPFSQISGGSEWWFLHSLVVILMWLWEEVSTMFTCVTILTRSLNAWWGLSRYLEKAEYKILTCQMEPIALCIFFVDSERKSELMAQCQSLTGTMPGRKPRLVGADWIHLVTTACIYWVFTICQALCLMLSKELLI